MLSLKSLLYWVRILSFMLKKTMTADGTKTYVNEAVAQKFLKEFDKVRLEALS